MSATICLLTDEELDVLTRGAGSPVATPFLDQLGAAAREVALQTAQRSLMVRQILAPVQGSRAELVAALDRDGGLPADITGLVRVVLDLRAGARVVCVLHRLVGAREDGSSPEPESLSRYVHVVDDVHVVEDVTPQGVHTFALTRRERLAELVTEFLVPPDAAETVPLGSGPLEVQDHGDAARLLAGLGHPTVLAEAAILTASREAERSRFTVALGPGGCFVGEEAPGGMRFVSTDAEGVVGRVVDAVAAAADALGG